MNANENGDVMNYERVGFDSSRGVTFGKAELHDDGYWVSVNGDVSVRYQ